VQQVGRTDCIMKNHNYGEGKGKNPTISEAEKWWLSFIKKRVVHRKPSQHGNTTTSGQKKKNRPPLSVRRGSYIGIKRFRIILTCPHIDRESLSILIEKKRGEIL